MTKGHAERVGFDKREAERLDARRKREAKAGTFTPEVTGAVTVRAYLTKWLSERTNRGSVTDKSLIRNYGLTCAWLCEMRMEDVRPRHAKKFVIELKEKVSQKSGTLLKPKYIWNISSAMKTAFRAAVLDEVIDGYVWILPPGMVSKKSDEADPYTREEAGKLLATATGARLVWLSLAFYTGMRCGEVCGRRWRDWDPKSTPLGCLTIATQYNDQPLKTDNPRRAPVHPELERVLRDWHDRGFEETYLRKPRPEDFIVPNRLNVLENVKRSASYKAVAKDCKLAGIGCRGQHATRHSFISALSRGGADEKTGESITHNAAGTMFDQYTHREWDQLCAAMNCVRPYGQNLVAVLDWDFGTVENANDLGSDSRTRTSDAEQKPAESSELAETAEAEPPAETGSPLEIDAELEASKDLPADAWVLRAAAEDVFQRHRDRKPIGFLVVGQLRKEIRDVG